MKKVVQQLCVAVSLLGALTPTSLLLQWKANNESDLAGYKVYWGTESRKYKSVANVGQDTSYTVSNLQPGYHYYIAATSYDHAGNESHYSEEVTFYIEPPAASENSSFISQCYNFPNPFNPNLEVTRIRYDLELPLPVTIKIMDANENLVRTLIEKNLKSAGEHTESVWDGKNDSGADVPNGIYFGLIETGEERHIIKIAVLK
ncbi:MAG: fibronectin type III domain-containing protein [Candidatus Zhuqueibacterota bacterium]